MLRCTYCIIPQVRPGLRSRSPEEIEAEVRRLIDNGYREIVISGIHVGHYGVDTTRPKSGKPPFRLWHLFRQLDRIPGDWRMRLSSIEANEVDDDFIDEVALCGPRERIRERLTRYQSLPISTFQVRFPTLDSVRLMAELLL